MSSRTTLSVAVKPLLQPQISVKEHSIDAPVFGPLTGRPNVLSAEMVAKNKAAVVVPQIRAFGLLNVILSDWAGSSTSNALSLDGKMRIETDGNEVFELKPSSEDQAMVRRYASPKAFKPLDCHSMLRMETERKTVFRMTGNGNTAALAVELCMVLEGTGNLFDVKATLSREGSGTMEMTVGHDANLSSEDFLADVRNTLEKLARDNVRSQYSVDVQLDVLDSKLDGYPINRLQNYTW